MDKLFAILGDIHSNLDALEVVLADCRAHGVTDYLCTGDIVGYGAQPHECLEMVRSLNCPIVMGNHDHYVSSRQDLNDFNDAARFAIEWTRRALVPEEIMFLRSLPFSTVKMGIALVHATLDNPENFGYVFDPLQAYAHFAHQLAPLCFHGHTHCPIIYEKTLSEVFRIETTDEWTLPVGKKYFINVGSVGQPRDGDPRASYVLYRPKDRKIWFRRLEYDVASAQQKILNAGLPERLAVRLGEGR